MVSITLSVPEDLKSEMDRYNFINWSAVAREAIKEKLNLLEKFQEFTKDSTITPEDSLKLGKKANEAVFKKHIMNR